ncbi:MAG: pilus assembly protein, partial [Shewanella sp.]|nr:pilus assembly protein [Shewanella sp.]
KSIEELGNYTGQCRAADDESIELECGEPKFSAIAVYAVEYDYQPMLSGFIAEPGMLRREVIVVQEYERDAFDF